MMFTVILSVAKDLASFVISQSPRTDNRSFVAEFTLSEAEGLLRMTNGPSLADGERVSDLSVVSVVSAAPLTSTVPGILRRTQF